MGRIADGGPEVSKAVRDELRKGADQIKIMVSGGVASQADPLESIQFRLDAIEAAVADAAHWGTYGGERAYSAEATERASDTRRRDRRHGHPAPQDGGPAGAGATCADPTGGWRHRPWS